MSFDKWKYPGGAAWEIERLAVSIRRDSEEQIQRDRRSFIIYDELECSSQELPDPSQNYLQLRNKRGKGKG